MIRARGLRQTFHSRRGREKVEVHAVAGVDIDVADGEVVGFLGPNGAGKTTTLRMLTTLLRPTAGEATVAGYDVVTQSAEVRRRIGYVSQVGSTGSEPRAGEEVVDHAMLYGLSRADATVQARKLFEELELDGLWDRKCSKMSGGQRRRLDVVMGLVHSPSLVFLDEPTTGLDPQARANLWQHIRGLRERRGATVFLTTHYLDEADALSDRIVIIDHGEIVAEDTAENLKRQVSGDLVEVEVADPARAADAAGVLDRAVRNRANVSGRAVNDVVVASTRLTARIDRAALALPDIVREMDSAGIALVSVDVTRPTLDDVFLDLTGRSLRDS
ncbi:ATP-binding cassette domain-containing protein [Dietzia sp. NPDC055340]